ncbi:hypothetical protein [Sinorhizobium americanum]|uniref:hypothetical protein n=1 Tax=Sinorhizobium americanum TaxID=194963 RepID=UPI0026ACE37C
MLYWSAVVNGMLAAPLIGIMSVMALNPRIMGRLTAPWWMVALAGFTAMVMGLATLAMFVL